MIEELINQLPAHAILILGLVSGSIITLLVQLLYALFVRMFLNMPLMARDHRIVRLSANIAAASYLLLMTITIFEFYLQPAGQKTIVSQEAATAMYILFGSISVMLISSIVINANRTRSHVD